MITEQQASIYINFVGIERHDNQQFKNKELVEWIDKNVPKECQNFAKWGVSRPSYLVGIYLDTELATIFKLKFEL